MVKLTESIILSRTKTGTIETVKKLNCWGCDLDDISIIERMASLEILSLSVNKIVSLQALSACSRLKELYLRGNNICELSEIGHLQNLSELRVLWLAENPCSDEPDYRNCVLRTLPRLTTLDNRPVSADEVAKYSESFIPSSRSEPTLTQSQYSAPCLDTLPSHLVSGDNNNAFRYERAISQCTNSIYGNENNYNNAMNVSFHRLPSPVPHSPFRENVDNQVKEDSFYKNSSYDLATQQRNGLVTLSDVYSTSYHSQLNDRRSSGSVKQDSSGNVLSAVIMLLDELDDRSLSVVLREAEKRLRRNV